MFSIPFFTAAETTAQSTNGTKTTAPNIPGSDLDSNMMTTAELETESFNHDRKYYSYGPDDDYDDIDENQVEITKEEYEESSSILSSCHDDDDSDGDDSIHSYPSSSNASSSSSSSVLPNSSLSNLPPHRSNQPIKDESNNRIGVIPLTPPSPSTNPNRTGGNEAEVTPAEVGNDNANDEYGEVDNQVVESNDPYSPRYSIPHYHRDPITTQLNLRIDPATVGEDSQSTSVGSNTTATSETSATIGLNSYPGVNVYTSFNVPSTHHELNCSYDSRSCGSDSNCDTDGILGGDGKSAQGSCTDGTAVGGGGVHSPRFIVKSLQHVGSTSDGNSDIDDYQNITSMAASLEDIGVNVSIELDDQEETYGDVALENGDDLLANFSPRTYRGPSQTLKEYRQTEEIEDSTIIGNTKSVESLPPTAPLLHAKKKYSGSQFQFSPKSSESKKDKNSPPATTSANTKTESDTPRSNISQNESTNKDMGSSAINTHHDTPSEKMELTILPTQLLSPSSKKETKRMNRKMFDPIQAGLQRLRSVQYKRRTAKDSASSSMNKLDKSTKRSSKRTQDLERISRMEQEEREKAKNRAIANALAENCLKRTSEGRHPTDATTASEDRHTLEERDEKDAIMNPSSSSPVLVSSTKPLISPPSSWGDVEAVTAAAAIIEENVGNMWRMSLEKSTISSLSTNVNDSVSRRDTNRMSHGELLLNKDKPPLPSELLNSPVTVGVTSPNTKHVSTDAVAENGPPPPPPPPPPPISAKGAPVSTIVTTKRNRNIDSEGKKNQNFKSKLSRIKEKRLLHCNSTSAMSPSVSNLSIENSHDGSSRTSQFQFLSGSSNSDTTTSSIGIYSITSPPNTVHQDNNDYTDEKIPPKSTLSPRQLNLSPSIQNTKNDGYGNVRKVRTRHQWMNHIWSPDDDERTEPFILNRTKTCDSDEILSTIEKEDSLGEENPRVHRDTIYVEDKCVVYPRKKNGLSPISTLLRPPSPISFLTEKRMNSPANATLVSTDISTLLDDSIDREVEQSHDASKNEKQKDHAEYQGLSLVENVVAADINGSFGQNTCGVSTITTITNDCSKQVSTSKDEKESFDQKIVKYSFGDDGDETDESILTFLTKEGEDGSSNKANKKRKTHQSNVENFTATAIDNTKHISRNNNEDMEGSASSFCMKPTSEPKVPSSGTDASSLLFQWPDDKSLKELEKTFQSLEIEEQMELKIRVVKEGGDKVVLEEIHMFDEITLGGENGESSDSVISTNIEENVLDCNSVRTKMRNDASPGELGENRIYDVEKKREKAACLIQRIYRGHSVCHALLLELGVAKRRRWEARTKSAKVTKIHSFIRRHARADLRERSKSQRFCPGGGSMVVAIRRICVSQIQFWWRSIMWRLCFLRRCQLRKISAAPLQFSKKTDAHSKVQVAELIGIAPNNDHSILRFQAHVRGYFVRKKYTSLQKVIIIQSFFRCLKARRHFVHKVRPAVVLIQSFARATLYSKIFRRERRLRLSYSAKEWGIRRQIVRLNMLKMSGSNPIPLIKAPIAFEEKNFFDFTTEDLSGNTKEHVEGLITLGNSYEKKSVPTRRECHFTEDNKWYDSESFPYSWKKLRFESSKNDEESHVKSSSGEETSELRNSFKSNLVDQSTNNVDDDNVSHSEDYQNEANNDTAMSVCLLRKNKNGKLGRLVKKLTRANEYEIDGIKRSARKSPFRKIRAKASEKPQVMLGDPEVNESLPDPLSLYRPMDDNEDKSNSCEEEALRKNIATVNSAKANEEKESKSPLIYENKSKSTENVSWIPGWGVCSPPSHLAFSPTSLTCSDLSATSLSSNSSPTRRKQLLLFSHVSSRADLKDVSSVKITSQSCSDLSATSLSSNSSPTRKKLLPSSQVPSKNDLKDVSSQTNASLTRSDLSATPLFGNSSSTKITQQMTSSNIASRNDLKDVSSVINDCNDGACSNILQVTEPDCNAIQYNAGFLSAKKELPGSQKCLLKEDVISSIQNKIGSGEVNEHGTVEHDSILAPKPCYYPVKAPFVSEKGNVPNHRRLPSNDIPQIGDALKGDTLSGKKDDCSMSSVPFDEM